MIPKLKKPEQYIGMGFAVWDEEHKVARKHICTDVRIVLERGDSFCKNTFKVEELFLLKVGWCSPRICFSTKGECAMSVLDSALFASIPDEPSKLLELAHLCTMCL